MAPARANQFKMLLSNEELEMLRSLAEARGLTASDYIRQFIRQQHDDTGAAAKPKPKPKRK